MDATVKGIRDAFFKGKAFYIQDLRMAGKILRSKGEDAVVTFLQNCKESSGDFQPPAKANVVAQSRPFEEWPIYKVSLAVQGHIFNFTSEQRSQFALELRREFYDRFLTEVGVHSIGVGVRAQALGLIFNNALKVYDGVIKKAENKNKKELERASKNKNYEPKVDPIFGENGKFLHPPSPNPCIYCYQQAPPRPFERSKFPKVVLPETFSAYSRSPVDPIALEVPDRLAIPKGSPGHVPEWQLPNLTTNKHKRLRRWYSLSKWRPKANRISKLDVSRLAEASAKEAILVIIAIGQDWVLLDARGLLRNLKWRSLVRKDTPLSIPELLGFFTGDSVIDPKRKTVTFIYKAESVNITSRNTVKGHRTKEALLKLTEPNADGSVCQVGMAAIDLGQTNPLAVEFSRITRAGVELQKECLERELLPNQSMDPSVPSLLEIERYRRHLDAVEDRIRAEALGSIPDQYSKEFAATHTGQAQITKNLVLQLGVSPDLPWDRMTSFTTYISDALIARGGHSPHVWFETEVKGKVERFKRRDRAWASSLRPQTSKEARKAFDERVWELKNTSPEYKRLSKRKLEFARHCVNHVLCRARNLSGCKEVVLAVEDLPVRMFHGSGKRDVGWENFFVRKRENRWFIQALHKALCEQGPHKGVLVLEVASAYTSMTCPACSHCDPNNRSENRESFCCLRCGRKFHCDLEVATHNIAHVAMSGNRLPGPIQASSEPSGGRKNKAGARKGQPIVTVGLVDRGSSPEDSLEFFLETCSQPGV